MKKSIFILLAAVGLIFVNTGQAIPGPGSVVKLRVSRVSKRAALPPRASPRPSC